MSKPTAPTPGANVATFEARILQPVETGGDEPWAFLVLPHEASAILPRRGRTTVAGTINGQPFQVLAEPDGRRSHWLRLDQALLEAAGVKPGETAHVGIRPVKPEPEPAVPPDLAAALARSPAARATWEQTTAVARVDWIHWIESAKQDATRAKRIADACDMLSSGKRRVCCFDPSGFYSKAFCAPADDTSLV